MNTAPNESIHLTEETLKNITPPNNPRNVASSSPSRGEKKLPFLSPPVIPWLFPAVTQGPAIRSAHPGLRSISLSDPSFAGLPESKKKKKKNRVGTLNPTARVSPGARINKARKKRNPRWSDWEKGEKKEEPGRQPSPCIADRRAGEGGRKKEKGKRKVREIE